MDASNISNKKLVWQNEQICYVPNKRLGSEFPSSACAADETTTAWQIDRMVHKHAGLLRPVQKL